VIPPCVNTAPDVIVPSGAVVSLPPGCYGDAVVHAGATLTLNAGIYNFSYLRLQNGSTLNGNGAVVNVQGDIIGGPNETIEDVTLTSLSSGTPAVQIGLSNSSPGSTLTNVLIYAPNDTVRTYKFVTGTNVEIVADTIRIGRRNTLGP
jgi:hypothetical protein